MESNAKNKYANGGKDVPKKRVFEAMFLLK